MPDEDETAPTKFGQFVTSDHIMIGNEADAGRKNQRSSLAILDRGTGWIGNYPTQNHTTANTKKALQEFAGPLDTVDRFYTDSARELALAGGELGWRHEAATPYIPHTNGVAERNVRRIIEGTRLTLTASGLSHQWWPEASRAFCAFYNFSHRAKNNLTPHEIRNAESFAGLLIPFGALVHSFPNGPSEKTPRKFVSQTQPSIMLGYHMHSGAKWSCDYLVVSRDDYVDTEVERDTHVQSVKEVIRHKDLVFAAKTRQFRRQYDDDEGRGETLADAPAQLAQYAVEPSREIAEKEDPMTIEQPPPAEIKTPQIPYYWERRGLFLVRVHKHARRKLFSPTEATDPSPVPIDEIDLLRQTKTDS